ncbi:hypothetical protein F5J12DRAFT_726520, partial [Pisolithus orientalis]|uniref:uncharacterized protein n=1 Tax=Pisolithus orientalis TaxID=936130 RepID=UPI0022244AC2
SLAYHLNSLYPGAGLDRIQATRRWCVDAVIVYKLATCHVRSGGEVGIIPPVSSG